MSNLPVYSTLFSTLYDEQKSVGRYSPGAHYSVLRSVVWHDATRNPNTSPQIHDLAIVWDEDHDTRIIEIIEKIYMAGVLTPILFIGERKGSLTVIVTAKFYYENTEADFKNYIQAINEIAGSTDDPWPSAVGCFDHAQHCDNRCNIQHLIQCDEYIAITYLKHIYNLWIFGVKNYKCGS